MKDYIEGVAEGFAVIAPALTLKVICDVGE
jgi:hypothetical protein